MKIVVYLLLIPIMFYYSCDDPKEKNREPDFTIYDYEYLKNRYFFIYEWFKTGIDTSVVIEGNPYPIKIIPFYPLLNGFHRFPGARGVKVQNFELYKSDYTNDPRAIPGIAYIDPLRQNEFTDFNRPGLFLRMKRDIDYTIDEDLGYIRLNSRLTSEILGACFTLVYRENGYKVLSIGHGISENDSTLSLKMIKPTAHHPNDPLWTLLWKNVYYLGKTFIESEKVTVKIVNHYKSTPTDIGPNNIPYITHFGLDSLDEQGYYRSDGNLDIINQNLFKKESGELVFPMHYPFVSIDSSPGGNINSQLINELGYGAMYFSTRYSQIVEDSRFLIEVYYEE